MGLVRFIAAVFSRYGRHSSTCSEPTRRHRDPRHDLGRRGELAARKYLRRCGYKVLYRNFRTHKGGEVDIVCRDGDTLVFVEVKTRSSAAFGTPAEAVTPSKQHLIARGALEWLRLLGHPADILFRFDVVEVQATGQKLEIGVIKNAFQLPEPYRY